MDTRDKRHNCFKFTGAHIDTYVHGETAVVAVGS